MRVLVTGAAGFIGSFAARALAAADHEVVAVVRPGSDRPRLAAAPAALTVAEADLDDADGVAALVRDVRPQAAVHAAWFVDPATYAHAVKENLACIEASTRLVRLLLEAGCGHTVVVGTGFEPAAGGSQGGTRPAQDTVYAASKSAVHQAVQRLGERGEPVTCAHAFYPYGPTEHRNRMIPAIIRSVLAGEPIEVTDGRQRRHYLHVADIGAALAAVAAGPAQGSIDLCAGEPDYVADVFAAIGEATGRPDLIRVGARPYGPGEVVASVGDPAPLAALGWRPALDLQQGIKDAVAWWQEQEEMA